MKYNYKMTMKSKERPQDIMRCFNKHIFRICFIDGEPYADEWDVIAYFKIRDYSQFLKHVPDDCRKQSHVSIMGIQALSYYYVDIEVDELLDWLGKMQDPNAPKAEKKEEEEMEQKQSSEQTAMTVFEDKQFGQVRTMIINGDIWFVAADVCKALEIGNPTMALGRLDDDEKALSSIEGLSRGNDKGNIVNEPGLYTLVLGSRKPEAKAFKRWITHEVIPSIRKNGGYIVGQEKMTEDQLHTQAQKVADNIINERDALRLKLFSADPLEVVEAHKKLLELETAPLKQTIKEQQPKVEFSDAVNFSHDGIMVKDLAHLLTQNGFQIGQNKLFELLRDDGFLCTGSGNRYNTPLQTSINRGIMCVREHGFQDGCGRVHLHFTTLITPKGQRFFLQKYANKVLSDEEISAMMAV